MSFIKISAHGQKIRAIFEIEPRNPRESERVEQKRR